MKLPLSEICMYRMGRTGGERGLSEEEKLAGKMRGKCEPLYNPLHPSSRTILLKLSTILSFLLSLLATCIRLLTVIYGYVILVAANLPNAPSTKISRGSTRLRFSSAIFSCSKMVYCSIGFTTSTSAGSTPANKAVGPSSLKSLTNVASVEGFLAGFSLLPGSN